MEIRPALQIQSMIKAMKDVVLPAVDPEHKMAVEQASLVIAMLGLMAKHLPLAYRYDHDELSRYVALAGELSRALHGGAVTKDAAQALEAGASNGAEILDRARAEPAELETAIIELRAEVSAAVLGVNQDGDEVSRARVRRLVMDAAKEQLDRERAWLIDMGFEPDPSAVPPIESLLKHAGR